MSFVCARKILFCHIVISITDHEQIVQSNVVYPVHSIGLLSDYKVNIIEQNYVSSHSRLPSTLQSFHRFSYCSRNRLYGMDVLATDASVYDDFHMVEFSFHFRLKIFSLAFEFDCN